ncbi:MAG: hypothetical protein ABSB99_11920 [Acidimicrobiales bacterium]|jgi:hypothetical protein
MNLKVATEEHVGPHHHVEAAADMVVKDLGELLESCRSGDGPAVTLLGDDRP